MHSQCGLLSGKFSYYHQHCIEQVDSAIPSRLIKSNSTSSSLKMLFFLQNYMVEVSVKCIWKMMPCLKSTMNYSTAVCLPSCQNNGICHIGDDNATAVCSCTIEWSGKHCEIRKKVCTAYYVKKWMYASLMEYCIITGLSQITNRKWLSTVLP